MHGPAGTEREDRGRDVCNVSGSSRTMTDITSGSVQQVVEVF